MTTIREPWTAGANQRRADMPVAEGELDDDLAKLVRRTSVVRQGFYVVVLLVALAGQVSGAVEALGIPLAAAIPAVAALELGGIVVLANADVRRRLGERAVASRLLSVSIAAAAVTFNWLAHADHLLGGFFAGMSALGYLVWLMHTENQRRDRLRLKGDLPPTTPAYEVAGHWLRHPFLTMRAKTLAKADPRLGLYDSLATARADVRRERRQAAIAKVLHRKIKAAVDPRTADIAIAVYDLDEIAGRLAAQADYDGLTALIAADLAPARLAPNGSLNAPPPAARRRRDSPDIMQVRDQDARAAWGDRLPEYETAPLFSDLDALDAYDAANGPEDSFTQLATNGHRPTNGHALNGHALPTEESPARRGSRVPAQPTPIEAPEAPEPPRRRRRAADALTADTGAQPTLPAPPAAPVQLTDLRREIGHLPFGRNGRAAPPPEIEAAAPDRSLRRRVHEVLNHYAMSGDQRDDMELLQTVYEELELADVDRAAAQNYVANWIHDRRTGDRITT
jgi:hypothetical protein